MFDENHFHQNNDNREDIFSMRRKLDEQTEEPKPMKREKAISRQPSMSPVIIRKNANKSPRSGNKGHRGAQMMQQMFEEEPSGDFLVCDAYECDINIQLPQEVKLPLSRSVPSFVQDSSSNPAEFLKHATSNVTQDGMNQHQPGAIKDLLESEAASMSTNLTQEDQRQIDRLSDHKAEQHAWQRRSCPDRNSKEDISKCDNHNLVSGQVIRQADKQDKVDKTKEVLEPGGGLLKVLSWPESLDGQLSQLDGLFTPQSSIRSNKDSMEEQLSQLDRIFSAQSSTRSKKVDKEDLEPKLRSPIMERHPLSWPQSIKSFGKNKSTRTGSTDKVSIRPPLIPDKNTATRSTTPPIQRRNTMSAIMGMKRPFQKQKSDSCGQFK